MKEGLKRDAELAEWRQHRIAELERKAALQQKIGELNARLAAIVEHSNDAIIGKDLNGIITSWNKGAEIIYGYAAEEMIGRPISLLVPSGYSDEIPIILDKIKRGGSLENYETIRVRKDGKQICVSLSVSPINDPKGELVGASTIARDITYQKQKEEEIRLHSEILKNMAEGVLLVRSKDGVIVYANPTFERMFGYDTGELAGKHVSIVNAPSQKDPEEVASEIIQALLAKGIWQGEVLNIKKDMTTFWCYANVSTFEHAQYGNVWLSVQQDIDERKQAEIKLKNALADAQRFREALDSVSSYVYMKDPQSRYVYANRSTLELFGRSPEELVGCDDTCFFPPVAVKRLREIDLRVFAGEETVEEIDIADTGSGRRVYWEIKTPIYADAERKTIWGLLGISTDITERKKMAEEKERLIGELKEALANVKTLSGMLPICTYCKKIRDDKGYWEEVASYITKHSDVLFSHGMCPDCTKKAYEELKKERRT